jgi:hypothetical protein
MGHELNIALCIEYIFHKQLLNSSLDREGELRY